ncbi:hypothetical protein NMY22_g13261 [Coprinellus aureogranulatus]|nr:hypothetical protein NMY22_g13261 [Coprinellus aureogranulatus]
MSQNSNPLTGKRTRRASFRVADPDNDGDFEMASHREARAAIQTQNSGRRSSSRTSTTSTRNGSVTCEDVDDEGELSSTSNTAPQRKRRRTAARDASDAPATSSSTASDAPTPTAPVQNQQDTSATPQTATSTSATDTADAADAVSSDDEEEEAPTRKVKPTLDIDAFFEKAAKRGPKGAQRVFRKCRVCVAEKHIVNETTTLRRHIQACHRKRYNKCGSGDQSTLDGHVQPIAQSEPVIKYSDALFQEAAEEWMISTNQPLDALSHPRFHHMIDVASRATNGVKIPEKRATRASILQRFKKNVAELKEKFNSSSVPGEISLTCDAWQAENRDAYFGVTGHWIEEVSPTDWRLRSALLGFTQMNTAHNGARLGRSLYDIAKRYGITHKIGWVTCDNASNNSTMLTWFQDKINSNKRRINAKVGKWDAKRRHIRRHRNVQQDPTHQYRQHPRRRRQHPL